MALAIYMKEMKRSILYKGFSRYMKLLKNNGTCYSGVHLDPLVFDCGPSSVFSLLTM